MKIRILTYMVIVAVVLISCEQKELPVNDYSFTATYTPADTTTWTNEHLMLKLSIDNYLADEDILLQYRINNSLADTLIINGTPTVEPYTFNPTIDKQLQIGFTPSKKGTNKVCINLSNSHYATEANIIIKAMEETTYTYDWKQYNLQIITVEGI